MFVTAQNVMWQLASLNFVMFFFSTLATEFSKVIGHITLLIDTQLNCWINLPNRFINSIYPVFLQCIQDLDLISSIKRWSKYTQTHIRYIDRWNSPRIKTLDNTPQRNIKDKNTLSYIINESFQDSTLLTKTLFFLMLTFFGFELGINGPQQTVQKVLKVLEKISVLTPPTDHYFWKAGATQTIYKKRLAGLNCFRITYHSTLNLVLCVTSPSYSWLWEPYRK